MKRDFNVVKVTWCRGLELDHNFHHESESINSCFKEIWNRIYPHEKFDEISDYVCFDKIEDQLMVVEVGDDDYLIIFEAGYDKGYETLGKLIAG